MANETLDLRLPSQPKSITALWPLPGLQKRRSMLLCGPLWLGKDFALA